MMSCGRDGVAAPTVLLYEPCTAATCVWTVRATATVAKSAAARAAAETTFILPDIAFMPRCESVTRADSLIFAAHKRSLDHIKLL
jgi:hypothetical protein